MRLMRANTPIRWLISRHTRKLLREYFKQELLSTRIADRNVTDRFIELTREERDIYEAVEDYIRTTYNQASDKECSAVGLVMVIYRRRLASSFRALGQTLGKRRRALLSGDISILGHDEDVPDDETSDEILDAEDVATLEQQALAFEEATTIHDLLQQIETLPPDSKVSRLKQEIAKLRKEGYGQVMVFTQYTDTIDFLRSELRQGADWRLMCFTGRGGEVPAGGDAWHTITRDDAKRRFASREADVLLCSEAAAEGLNFQFCGALINYDMPWNPMKVEQRIGRIDRLGQQHAEIRIINLHYKDTVETDVYVTLRERINIFEVVVGHLQPILSRLSRRIERAVLEGTGRNELAASIATDVDDPGTSGLELDSVTDDGSDLPHERSSPVTMEDLDRVLRTPELLPSDIQVDSLRRREYKMLLAGREASIRVTTDPEYYEKYADSVELWSPGNPLFKSPEIAQAENSVEGTLASILDQCPHNRAQ